MSKKLAADKADKQEEGRDKLRELLELEEGLTSWEVDFLEKVSHQSFGLTGKQLAKIDELFEDKIG